MISLNQISRLVQSMQVSTSLSNIAADLDANLVAINSESWQRLSFIVQYLILMILTSASQAGG